MPLASAIAHGRSGRGGPNAGLPRPVARRLADDGEALRLNCAHHLVRVQIDAGLTSLQADPLEQPTDVGWGAMPLGKAMKVERLDVA
jgi:hypothetical protein